jgi:hypothetical protein
MNNIIQGLQQNEIAIQVAQQILQRSVNDLEKSFSTI